MRRGICNQDNHLGCVPSPLQLRQRRRQTSCHCLWTISAPASYDTWVSHRLQSSRASELTSEASQVVLDRRYIGGERSKLVDVAGILGRVIAIVDNLFHYLSDAVADLWRVALTAMRRSSGPFRPSSPLMRSHIPMM